MTKKIFLTLEEQCELLKKRGITLRDDLEKEKNILKKYNYAFLIYNYDVHFKKNERFKEGVNLDSIISFISFEQDLISWISPYIYKYEHTIKSVMAYIIASEAGDSFPHYKKNIYLQKHPLKIIKIKQNLLNAEKYVLKKYENQADKLVNGRLPIWILIQELTFNDVLLLFEQLRSELKEKILKNLEYNGNVKVFKKGSRLIKEYRNRYCHNFPIYKPYQFHRSNKEYFLNDCLLSLMRMPELSVVKNKIVVEMRKLEQKNSIEKQVDWLENIYKIKIKQELNLSRNTSTEEFKWEDDKNPSGTKGKKIDGEIEGRKVGKNA